MVINNKKIEDGYSKPNKQDMGILVDKKNVKWFEITKQMKMENSYQ